MILRVSLRQSNCKVMVHKCPVPHSVLKNQRGPQETWKECWEGVMKGGGWLNLTLTQLLGKNVARKGALGDPVEEVGAACGAKTYTCWG